MVAIHLLTNNWVVIVIDPHRVVLQNIALTAHQFNPRDAHIVRGFCCTLWRLVHNQPYIYTLSMDSRVLDFASNAYLGFGISLYARIALAEGLPETYKFGSDSL